jgi:hypothetical protein
MGGYRSEDEALIGLARQLTDAYGEARRREDQDFACDSVAAFLAEFRQVAPNEALLAILDLPLTAETYPLVDEAQTTLARRGAAVVKLLLEGMLGEVYDPDGPAPERAAETLDMMDRRESLQGLIRVLCGRAGDDVKGAAVDGLVALGAFAEPALAAALDDPDGGDWAQAALEQLRYQRTHPPALEDYADGEDWAPDDESRLFEWREDDEGEADDDPTSGGAAPAVGSGDGLAGRGDGTGPGAAGHGPGPVGYGEAGGADEPLPPPAPAEPAEPPGPATPDQGLVDDAYDEFLRRYRDEPGGPPSP